MRTRVLVVVMVIATGCVSSNRPVAQLGGTVAAVGVATILVGGVVAFFEHVPPPEDPDHVGHTGRNIAIGGLIAAFVGGGTYIAASASSEPSAKAEPVPQAHPEREQASAKARERAWELTQFARVAARNGDCASVMTTSERIRALDADFHATVFVRDVAIQRWLSGSATP